MPLVQRLDLRQAQTLVMTPQLQQAIKLLQLSNLEITDFVAQEMQQNPLLEEADRTDQDQPLPTAETNQDRVPAATETDAPAAADDQAAAIESGAIAEPEHELSDEPGGRDDGDGQVSFQAGLNGGSDSEPFDLASRLTRELSLREHLLEQLNTEIDDPKARLIGAALIEMVEPSGYLADGAQTVQAV